MFPKEAIAMRWIKSKSLFLLIWLMAALLGAAVAETPRAAKPEDIGISSQGLQRIHDLIQCSIDARNFSGAVPLVSRNGKIAYFEAQGLMDIETNKPMATGLTQDYAAASNGTKHKGGSALFAVGHTEKLVDFGYHSMREMAIRSEATRENEHEF
jgi:hypothetical protein